MRDDRQPTPPPIEMPPAAETVTPAYERPELVRVGSLRDLVGKSGPAVDVIGPQHRRS